MWPFRKKQSDQSSTASQPNGWVLTGMNGLSCHMKQPNGPSRPATLWTIKAVNGSAQKMLLVQDYMDDPGGRTSEQSATAAMQFVMELIGSGWNPNDYKGEPGELIVSDRAK
jgi:hypothetical protein